VQLALLWQQQQRIDWCALAANFEVQQGLIVQRFAHLSDVRPPRYLIPFFDQDLSIVTIGT
jgi:hypothetical protein